MLKYVDAVSTRAADARRLSPESPLKSRADSWWNCRSTRSTGTLLGVVPGIPPGTPAVSPDMSVTLSGYREEVFFIFHELITKNIRVKALPWRCRRLRRRSPPPTHS